MNKLLRITKQTMSQIVVMFIFQRKIRKIKWKLKKLLKVLDFVSIKLIINKEQDNPFLCFCCSLIGKTIYTYICLTKHIT